MTGPRLRTQLTVAGVAVSAVLVADSSGLLGEGAAIALDDAAQLAGGLFASVWCGLGARRTRAVRRNWRRLMAIGMLGWSIGQLVWSYYQVFKRTPLPSPSWADVGYLTMPVFALAALLAIAANGIAAQRRQLPAAGSGAPGGSRPRRTGHRRVDAGLHLGHRARHGRARGRADRSGLRGRHRLPDHRPHARGDRAAAAGNPAGTGLDAYRADPPRARPGRTVQFGQHLRVPDRQRRRRDAADRERRFHRRTRTGRPGRAAHRTTTRRRRRRPRTGRRLVPPAHAV